MTPSTPVRRQAAPVTRPRTRSRKSRPRPPRRGRCPRRARCVLRSALPGGHAGRRCLRRVPRARCCSTPAHEQAAAAQTAANASCSSGWREASSSSPPPPPPPSRPPVTGRPTSPALARRRDRWLVLAVMAGAASVPVLRLASATPSEEGIRPARPLPADGRAGPWRPPGRTAAGRMRRRRGGPKPPRCGAPAGRTRRGRRSSASFTATRRSRTSCCCARRAATPSWLAGPAATRAAPTPGPWCESQRRARRCPVYRMPAADDPMRVLAGAPRASRPADVAGRGSVEARPGRARHAPASGWRARESGRAEVAEPADAAGPKHRWGNPVQVRPRPRHQAHFAASGRNPAPLRTCRSLTCLKIPAPGGRNSGGHSAALSVPAVGPLEAPVAGLRQRRPNIPRRSFFAGSAAAGRTEPPKTVAASARSFCAGADLGALRTTGLPSLTALR